MHRRGGGRVDQPGRRDRRGRPPGRRDRDCRAGRRRAAVGSRAGISSRGTDRRRGRRIDQSCQRPGADAALRRCGPAEGSRRDACRGRAAIADGSGRSGVPLAEPADRPGPARPAADDAARAAAGVPAAGSDLAAVSGRAGRDPRKPDHAADAAGAVRTGCRAAGRVGRDCGRGRPGRCAHAAGPGDRRRRRARAVARWRAGLAAGDARDGRGDRWDRVGRFVDADARHPATERAGSAGSAAGSGGGDRSRSGEGQGDAAVGSRFGSGSGPRTRPAAGPGRSGRGGPGRRRGLDAAAGRRHGAAVPA